MDTLQRDYRAELSDYQSQFPDDTTGYFRITLNNLAADLAALQAGDYFRFDYQSYPAHLHEAKADAAAYTVELYGYMRGRLVDVFEAGLFCLDAMPGGTPEHQRARGFVFNVLDELRNAPDEPLTPDDAKAVHYEIGVLLFEAVQKRITTGAIEAVAAVADVSATTGQKDTPERKIIEIELGKISNGLSKKLLIDLILNPDGVRYDSKMHGAKQPDNLKAALSRNGYTQAANAISKSGRTILIKTNFSIISKK